VKNKQLINNPTTNRSLNKLEQVDTKLRQAFALQQQNKTTEATSIYLEVLKNQPNNFNALQLFGSLLIIEKKYKEAINYLKKAVEINSTYAHCYNNLGMAYKALLEHQKAITSFTKAIELQPSYIDAIVNRASLYLEILQFNHAIEDYSLAIKFKPDFAEVIHNRGYAFMKIKQFGDAIENFSIAINLKPNFAEAFCNRAYCFTEQKNYDAAIADCDQAINLKPNLAEAFLTKGNVYAKINEYTIAIENYDVAIQIQPHYAEAYSNRGSMKRNLKRLEDAYSDYTIAININPDYAEAYSNRGCLLIELMRFEDALNDQNNAIKLDPNYAPAYSNKGNALKALKRFDDAIKSYEHAIALNQNFAAAWVGHGSCKQQQKQLGAALESYDRAINLDPKMEEAHANKGGNLRLQAKYVDALMSTKVALQIKPELDYALQNYSSILAFLSDYEDVCQYSDLALIHASKIELQSIWGNRLYHFIYHPDLNAEQIVAEHIKWGNQFSNKKQEEFADKNRNPQRRLRIGYVSPDFRNHSCRYYFEPLFSNHNHEDFEVFAYSNVFLEDEHTDRMKAYFDHWRVIHSLDDVEAAQMIRNDEIDILIDGCGHMMDTRLDVFTHKPSPIQVTWLGAAWTTGLPQMDYVLFDPFMAPEGAKASEQIIRLPQTWTAFRPGDRARQANIQPLPANANGYITFGYSGRTERLNHRVFKVWGRILNRLPQARLVLDYKAFVEPKTAQYYRDFLQKHGVDTSRVVMRHSENIFEGLGDIDILLDSFPHSGGTMLFDAVWMGVPVITLASDRPVGRIGTSLMTNLGLSEWVASDEQEYEDKAVGFAQDTPSLFNLRTGMRERMQSSPVMDEASFAGDVEQAFKAMWQKWIDEQAVRPTS
jgi:predicted O-linked N-acetylglucosamine transferase (SPINDLY family)